MVTPDYTSTSTDTIIRTSEIKISDIKKVISTNFSAERDKKRLSDPEKNRELVTHIGNLLTILEMSIKKDIERLDRGESIHDIYTDLV